MKAPQTPGPWQVDGCPDAHGFWTIRPADGSEHGDTDAQPIATVYRERDADMIAAAPELYEVLRALLAEADTAGGADRTVSRYSVDKARAALAPATP